MDKTLVNNKSKPLVFVINSDFVIVKTGEPANELYGYIGQKCFEAFNHQTESCRDCRMVEYHGDSTESILCFKKSSQFVHQEILSGDEKRQLLVTIYPSDAGLSKQAAQCSHAELFYLSMDMMCIASLDGYFKEVNPAFVEGLGYSEEELTTQPYFNFIHPDDKEKTSSIIGERALNNQAIIDFQNRYICKNGKVKWLSWYTRPDAENNRLYAIARDITHLKVYQHELEVAKDKAEQADRLKTTFLANMSHEIRTPLNAIVGFSDLLIKDYVDKETREMYAEIISSRSNDLLQIINDIIDVSKIEAAQLKIHPKPLNINSFIHALSIDYKFKIKRSQKNISFATNIDGRLNDSTLILDEIRLKQILVNLLDNALKFTKEGSIELESFPFDDSFLCFSVSDTGIGIPVEQQDIIFDMFRQSTETLTREYGGNGLGLTICRSLATLMGGSIALESEPGKGSKFNLYLPLKRLTFNSHANQVQKNEGIPENCKQILIVEDDKSSQLLLSEIFENKSVVCHFLVNGKTVMPFLEDNFKSIDLILLDIQLPDISGLELAPRIKELYPGIPIIAQTAYAMNTDEEVCLLAGCDAYVSKPINTPLLMEKINWVFKV